MSTSDPHEPVLYSSAALDAARDSLQDGNRALAQIARRIVADAGEVLRSGPFTVTHKPRLALGVDQHDYCSLAPYFWPTPDSSEGLPYIERDGERSPETVLFSPESERHDRSRLQRLFDGTTILALAWRLTGRDVFATHGANFVRTWFIDPVTRMNPHLSFAQVRKGHNGNRGAREGIIEFKDVHFFLDAVRLIESSGALSEEDGSAFRNWLSSYLGWLLSSDFGHAECARASNHGTYFDLQVVAIQAYLRDRRALGQSFLRMVSRIAEQFAPDGAQPAETCRTISKHYVYFNLQGWFHLIGLLKQNGFYDLDYSREPYVRITAALDGVRRSLGGKWPYQQIAPFDEDRIYPLLRSATVLGFIGKEKDPANTQGPATSVKARFNSLLSIPPYWQLTFYGGAIDRA